VQERVDKGFAYMIGSRHKEVDQKHPQDAEAAVIENDKYQSIAKVQRIGTYVKTAKSFDGPHLSPRGTKRAKKPAPVD
jgi:hypothetical protein